MTARHSSAGVTEMASEETIRRPEALGNATHRRADRVLSYATIFFAAAFLFHNADHMRRGFDTVTPEVLGAGYVASVGALFVIALVIMRHRFAPLVAVAVGFSTALGVAATHLLPQWSSFSDSFPDGRIDALSWTAGVLEVVGAFALGAAGWYVLRHTE